MLKLRKFLKVTNVLRKCLKLMIKERLVVASCYNIAQAAKIFYCINKLTQS